MKWSPHARERAKQRFPDESLDVLVSNLQRVGKKLRRRIKEACPVSARKWMQDGFAGRYCLINRGRDVVFVVEAPDTVVTVFRLERSTESSLVRSPENAQVK